MQLTLPWTGPRPRTIATRAIEIAGQTFPIEICRRRGARRYIVRVTADAIVRLTVPHGAPIARGVAFATRQSAWIAREWKRQQTRTAAWNVGDRCWFRGEQVAVGIAGDRALVGGIDVGSLDPDAGLRASVERGLRELARVELPARCLALAGTVRLTVARVSVRNQRARWGACSTRQSITLNWRLVQTPERVRDYIIWHELAHLLVPNHSRRFWREVARLCPSWRDDEAWLKEYEAEIL
ncbi:MAG TPA: SprT family zinc-dependent metalloprotease [Vicinamibacterales bacterium]|nr:SprT family zinc-dependent metalloprotease [Vicinamibacterales bacterium]